MGINTWQLRSWQGVSGEDVSKGVCGFVPVYAWGRRVCEFRIGIQGAENISNITLVNLTVSALCFLIPAI